MVISIGQRVWSPYMGMSLNVAVYMPVLHMSAGGVAAAGVAVGHMQPALPQL